MNREVDLLVTTSPQIHHPDSTAKIMWTVVICLVPAGIWGVFLFGGKALLVIISSIVSALVTEFIIAKLLKRFTVLDGSAFLTGLLVGYNMPPGVPLYIPAIASIFAIAVVKWTFGGLGANWMNPALAGRVFVFFSWTGSMTNWRVPRFLTTHVDGVTMASPLGFIKAGLYDFTGTSPGPIAFLKAGGYPLSALDQSVTNWINTSVLNPLGASLKGGYVDLFLGIVPGCIGEVSALLLLLGTVYLFIKKIITWEIPVSYLFVFGLLIWIFGGLRFNNGLFTGDVMFNFFTGGLILGVFYMATDMVTSPLTTKGKLIFGAGAGFMTFLIRVYGSFPEGVSLAIIFMNIFVPLINKYTKPVRFGVSPRGGGK
ncbi:MAG: electron transporter RnfD [Spirochaetes bacterium]|nr:MAG: electron transporter RnfD [Spirochaetota bacterium]